MTYVRRSLLKLLVGMSAGAALPALPGLGSRCCGTRHHQLEGGHQSPQWCGLVASLALAAGGDQDAHQRSPRSERDDRSGARLHGPGALARTALQPGRLLRMAWPATSAAISRPSTRRSCRACTRTMRPPRRPWRHGWRRSSLPAENIMGGRVIASFNYNSVFLFSKTPINKLDDLKGMKVRTFSLGLVDYISALGGEPVSMPVADLYTGLERGTIQAAITGPDRVEGQRLYEVCKYMTDLQLGSSPAYTVVSRRSWDHLPADLKKVVRTRDRPAVLRSGLGSGPDQQQDRHRARQGQGHDRCGCKGRMASPAHQDRQGGGRGEMGQARRRQGHERVQRHTWADCRLHRLSGSRARIQPELRPIRTQLRSRVARWRAPTAAP